MSEPIYVAIAREYARQIRSGELPPGTQLPSLSEMVERHRVSDIVVRKAVELLQSQGLVRSVRRRGNFVVDQPNLVRVSPERERESSDAVIQSEVDQEQVPATEALARAFGITVGDPIMHVVTRAAEAGRPISISDTYQPLDVLDVVKAAELEEMVADRLPPPSHAEWLRTTPGDLVKTVRQRFFSAEGRLLVVSDISYPQGRYDVFLFRMSLRP